MDSSIGKLECHARIKGSSNIVSRNEFIRRLSAQSGHSEVKGGLAGIVENNGGRNPNAQQEGKAE
jgi:hypothetical protein